MLSTRAAPCLHSLAMVPIPPPSLGRLPIQLRPPNHRRPAHQTDQKEYRFPVGARLATRVRLPPCPVQIRWDTGWMASARGPGRREHRGAHNRRDGLLSFADLSDGLRNWLAGWVGCDLRR